MLYIDENMNDISLPPGKKLSVGLSIVRPLKIESSGAIFCDFRRKTWNKSLICESLLVIQF